eukprot:scaffold103588_cov50-Attheya_sp.AAC.3
MKPKPTKPKYRLSSIGIHDTYGRKKAINMFKSLTLSLLAISAAQAFTPSFSTKKTTHLLDGRTPTEGGPSSLVPASSPLDAFLEGIKTRIRIGQESNAKGFGGKQVIADVIAGEYDEAASLEIIEDAIASAPCGTYNTNYSH